MKRFQPPPISRAALDYFDLRSATSAKAERAVRSPITGEIIGHVQDTSPDEVARVVAQAADAFAKWRSVPAPRRGLLVREFGEALRGAKHELGEIVAAETGKITTEALGEVQEMIDICDYAVGLSRQLYGLTMATERAEHRMMETWHPLGVVGVISAFNFPVAVWSWNALLALVCGNAVVWKPSEKTPLSAVATQKLMARAVEAFGADAPPGLLGLVLGGADVGQALVDDRRVALVSATGSTAMGRRVAPRVASRLGRTILELGGNNAAIVAPSADLPLTLRAIAFAAVGTCGQRCTSLRRLIVHESIYDQVVPKLVRIYDSLPIGDPREPGVLVGPLLDEDAYRRMEAALAEARELGGTVHGGERVHAEDCPGAFYVRPALCEMPSQGGPVLRETFAPILYAMKYRDFEDAIRLHNAVDAGLASSVFTLDVREAERFVSVAGSDCGIANVNIGPSGAEIGGAFGGEKDTGGGREAGSDAWKGYMRRATNTINFGASLPLSQGIKFDVDV
jgi:aldehyde dehydrogenase (NAD+)